MASTLYSPQVTTVLAKQAGSGASLEPIDLGGRVRVAAFSYLIPSGQTPVTIALALLPKGSRIVGLQYQVDVSTGTMKLEFGLEDADGGTTYSDTAKVKAAAVLTSVGAANAVNYGTPVSGTAGTTTAVLPKLTEDAYLTVTTSVANAPAAIILTGYAFYVDQMG